MGSEQAQFNTLIPRVVAGLSAVAVVLVLGIVWLLCCALDDASAGAERHRRVQQLCGRIIHLDEVLTMSAKMCAVTGDMEWEDRYDEQVAELEATIREVEASALLSDPDPGADISTANIRLVEMEQEAFRLAAAGMQREAMAILESEPYELNKQRYSKLTQARVDLMLDEESRSLRGERWNARATVAAAVVVMCLILGSCSMSLSVMRKYLGQVKRTQDALRQTQEGLERRVEDRTADLENANEKLQLSYQELQVIYDGMPDGLGIADLETKRLVQVNPSLCKTLGYSEDELLAMSVTDIRPPGARSQASLDFELVAKQPLPVAENVAVLKKDGNIFYADIAASLLNYRRRRCVVGFFRDVTKRREANKALRKSEETARALVNAVMESALLIEVDGTIVALNETAAQRMGGTAQELAGRYAFDLMPPEVAEPRKRQVDLVIRTGKPLRWEDDRAGRVYDCQGYPVFDADGNVTRVAVYAQDITERKRAHETLERERHRLKQLLDSSDRERKLMSYEIHDGLAQQLTGALMQFQAVEPLRDDNAQVAAQAFGEGLRMLRQSISETRRLISGLRPPIIDEMGIVLAIEHLANDYTAPGGPGIEFSHDVAFGRLEPVLENALFRIAQESLANACRHSKSDRVRIELAEREGLVRIATRDWGVGFEPQEVKEDAFGLDGIRERARLFGGRAIIDSVPGEGTSIVVELPMRLGDPDAPNGPA